MLPLDLCLWRQSITLASHFGGWKRRDASSQFPVSRGSMNLLLRRVLSRVASSFLLIVISTISVAAQSNTTEISSTPSSVSFANTYVGKASGNRVLTINNLTSSGQIIIETVGFDCAGYGIASGVAPFTLGQTQKITHYSIFFQPSAAQSYNCNFIITLNDGSYLDVPLSGTGLTANASATVSPSTLTFSNQTVGSTSGAQTVTITNTGTSSLSLQAITLSPPDFITNAITLPYTIDAGASLPVSVYYTPSQAISETGAIDFSYDKIPDNGSALNGNGVAAKSLVDFNLANVASGHAECGLSSHPGDQRGHRTLHVDVGGRFELAFGIDSF